MPKVFVSHSTKDRTFVEQEIIRLLNSHGIETWYSRDDIRTADTWLQTIHKGLQSCDWFLVVMSRNSANSEYVKDEVSWAIEKRWPGRFIPVLIDDCDPVDFHLRMPRIQYVAFVTDLQEARKRLLAAWGIQLHAMAPAGPVVPAKEAVDTSELDSDFDFELTSEDVAVFQDCPQCGCGLKISNLAAGPNNVKCSECGAIFKVVV